MGAETMLTRDDLDELSEAADEAADPAEVAAELTAAAGGGHLADPGDAGYAYLLAAEIYERSDDLARALATADLALAAYQASGDRDPCYARAFRAELLLRLGREREGMAELERLRPQMTSNALAASYVPEALAAGGYAETARSWLTAALAELSGAHAAEPVVAQLVAARERLQEPESDQDAEEPIDEPELVGDTELVDRAAPGPSEAVLLVWPREEYEEVDERWPEVLEATGADDWDGYRRRQQALIAEWRQRSRAPLWQVTGTAEGFAEFLAEQGADLVSADLVSLAEQYGDYLAELEDPQPLPPAPADPCWCRSSVPYEKCCLPLTPHDR